MRKLIGRRASPFCRRKTRSRSDASMGASAPLISKGAKRWTRSLPALTPLLSHLSAKSNFMRAVLKVKVDAHLPRAAYDFSVANTNGQSTKVKLYIDDLPVITENRQADVTTVQLPTVVWGELNPATDSDMFSFSAKNGQTIVF